MSADYSEHPSMFRNNPLGFVLCVLLIPVFGLGLLILLYWYLQAKASKLSITGNEIHYEKGLLSKERFDISVSSVRTVHVNQSFFDRIFGVGTIKVYTAGDNPEIYAKGLPEPNRVREIIKQRQGSL